jgi:hypothetical protein
VVSATEKISDDPEGIMLEGVLESLAEYYSANLSKHIKRGMHESVMKGTYTGSIPPFGFKVLNKKLVADEEKAPIIQWVFEQYAAGYVEKGNHGRIECPWREELPRTAHVAFQLAGRVEEPEVHRRVYIRWPGGGRRLRCSY